MIDILSFAVISLTVLDILLVEEEVYVDVLGGVYEAGPVARIAGKESRRSSVRLLSLGVGGDF